MESATNVSAAAGLAIPTGRRAGRSRGGGSAEKHDADAELVSLREELRRHPAHREPGREAQVRVAERYLRIERDNAALQKKVAAATNSLARTFDRIVIGVDQDVEQRLAQPVRRRTNVARRRRREVAALQSPADDAH